MNLKSISMIAVSTLALGAATSARAQDAAAADENAAKEIIVTGSRIQNPNFTAPTPVQVLNAEDIAQRAPANIADVVNEIPAFRTTRQASGVGRTADFQAGVQTLVDLRGLGDVRTLVLINGHRHIGTVERGSVDTSMIPVGLVERVEVVTGGASAAYGSDAVAGVTNFILRNHMTGLNGSIQYGITDKGDGDQISGNLAGGISLADNRLHLIAGVDAAKTTAIGNMLNRSWGLNEPGLLSVSSGQRTSLGLPAAAWATNVEYANVTPFGLIQTAASNSTRYSFDAAGNPVAFTQGTVFGTGANATMTGSTSNYGYGPNTFFQLQNANSRVVAYGRAEFEASDSLKLYVEGNYGRTSMPRQLTTAYTTLITVARTSLPTALQPLYTGTNVQIGRIMTENGGGNTTWQDLTVHRILAGVSGNIAGFDFDAYYQHGETHQNFNTSGLVLSALYKASYGCDGTLTNPNMSAALITQLAAYESITGKTCTAINPIGQITNSSALNYIYNDQHQETFLKQDVASISFSGKPFALPAGDVSIAFGGEYRKESSRVVGSALGQANVFSQGNFGSYGGSNEVTEGFAEVGVPLLGRDSGMGKLDLNGAIRRTDYKLSGAVTTWKLGGVWEPMDGLRLRVTHSRDIRAPNLNELYFAGGALPTSLQNAITGSTGFGNTSTTVVRGTGSTSLKPEFARTWTAGVTYQTSSFRFAADYYNINISGAIARLNTAQTQAACATLLAAGQTTCPGITFSTTGNGIASLDNRSVNLNRLKAEGMDFELGYTFREPFGVPGKLELRAMATVAFHLQQYLSLIRPQPFETAGSAQGVPKLNYNFTVGYENGNSGIELQLRGFNKVKYDALTPLYDPSDGTVLYSNTASNSISQNYFKGMMYTNLSWHIGVTKNIQLFGVVNNLFNLQPPLYVPVAITNGGRNLSYDLLGRAYKVGARFKF